MTGTISDGRQSERALAIRRGAARRLAHEGWAPLYEWVLPSGRRADIAALGPRGEILIVEVKSSPEDFLSDRKWPDYLAFCDRFSFATGPHVPAELFPEDHGLIIADSFGAETLRPPSETALAPARRKSLMVSLARTALTRIHAGDDPGAYLRL
ncbi:MAG: MmcB family DNA repair protein [Hyphomicrobiaceae bacterium]|nr:MmcB family DNA repair protein [Hyphomicrobiaceae bacterium]